VPRLLRAGVISVERLRDVIPLAVLDETDGATAPGEAPEETPDGGKAAGAEPAE
jgi:hypothetical protein